MDSNLISVIAFWSFGLLFTVLEAVKPARPITYRKFILYDLGAVVMYTVFFQMAVVITDRIPVPRYVPATILGLPLYLKLILFFIVEDFGLYWVHRFMHTRHVWRVHKWHHSPTYMYWFAGVRATFPHCVLFNLPFVLALPILYRAPSILFPLVMVEHLFRNDWMHMNVTWRSNWLEWVVVTPRYHHIHHSEVPQHHVANLGSLLTIWDRMFGTYVNPHTIKTELSFGIGEKDPSWRVMLGI